MTSKGIMVEWEAGWFHLLHPRIGHFLSGSVVLCQAGRYGCSCDPGYRTEVESDEGEMMVHCRSEGLPSFRLLFRMEGDTIGLTVETEEGSPASVEVQGELFMGPEPYLGRLEGEGNGIFSLACGPVSSLTARSLFNRFNDSAVTLPRSRLYHRPHEPAHRYRFLSQGVAGEEVFRAQVTLDVIKGYGIRYYAPLDKSVFDHAPTGWCSWYYYYQRINEEEWERNVRWLAENLRPFGVEWVQLDDGWQWDNGSPATSGGRDWRGANEKFPRGMKWAADFVKQQGMRPGIWLIPQKTDSDEVFQAHPEWFLRRPDGTPVRIGDWHPRKVASYVVDPTNPQALEYLKALFHTLAYDWGFDYFKIDNQPEFSRWYDEHAEARRDGSLPGSEAYRLTLQAIREAIGPNKYLLGCYGIPLDGIGWMNGSRTGGDMSASWQGCQVMIRTITRWGFLNNVVWWCDPDTLCVREPLTLEEARLMATLVSLSGQALMTSDKMDELPPERVEILKRVCPTVDIRPMEFYPWDEEERGRPRIFDLKISRHYGDWDVVAIFNWEEEPVEVPLDLAQLGLPVGEGIAYHAFDFWSQRYEGLFSEGIPVSLAMRQCKVLSLRRALGYPQVVSTSRHITQGAVDLEDLVWAPGRGEMHGVSRLVGGDPYRIFLHLPPGYALEEFAAEGEALSSTTRFEEGLLVAEILSPTSQRVEWRARFRVDPG